MIIFNYSLPSFAIIFSTKAITYSLYIMYTYIIIYYSLVGSTVKCKSILLLLDKLPLKKY